MIWLSFLVNQSQDCFNETGEVVWLPKQYENTDVYIDGLMQNCSISSTGDTAVLH